MKVRAIKEYNDLQKKRLVKVGEEFEVSAERGKELLNAKVAEEIVAEAPAETPAEAPKAPTKKAPKKKEA